MERRRRDSIDVELTLVNGQLQNLQQRAADFQRIMDDIQKMKDNVVAEMDGVEQKKRELEAQKEPINWLPTELLIQVFVALAECELNAQDVHYRPSLAISHTCAKWRAIAMVTPELWSRVVLHGFRQRDICRLYLLRSVKSPLEIDYCTPPDTMATTECCRIMELLAILQSHFYRLTTLSLQTRTALPLTGVLPWFSDPLRKFPQLRVLTLAILTPNPTFLEAFTLLDPESNALIEPPEAAHSSSRLFHLKIEKIPLYNLPAALVSNLRSLNLSYSPRKLGLSRNYYYLKMSTLCRFLVLTPLLEELVLADTVPYFDVTPQLEGASTVNNVDPLMIEMKPVNLDHLKSIDWTYPYPTDVHRLFSMIEMPVLEKLDLWVEDSRGKRHDSLLAYPVVSSPHKYTRGVINFPLLRDLSLQCDGEDTTAYVLRKFNVPALQKVEFTNFDPSASKGVDDASSLPTFPRLESIFRDPRLLHLTHLTLSHYKISSEAGRVEALLGYMPVLTSLSFDSCARMGTLLKGLQETFVGAIKGGGVGGRSRRGVKVCPRLDTLSFWGCQDLDCASLRAVVLSRNRSIDVFEEDSTHSEKGAEPVIPDGATQNVTRGAQEGKASGGQTTEAAQMGRKIKPLRSVRRPGLGDAGVGMPSTIAATIITKEESFKPAHISFLRVANCKEMTEEEVLAFRDLGVVDIIWTGSG